MSNINHPSHYGGGENPYEVIKVIESWGIGWGFCAGNAVKYIRRAPFKGSELDDIDKSIWYLNRICEKGYSQPLTAGEGMMPWEVAEVWELPTLLGLAVIRLYNNDVTGALEAVRGHRQSIT